LSVIHGFDLDSSHVGCLPFADHRQVAHYATTREGV
jgi:hypothetical protein